MLFFNRWVSWCRWLFWYIFLGFFACITIEADNVILDLNDKTIKMNEIDNEIVIANELEFEKFYDYTDLCNWPLCPTPAPTTNFNGIDVGICENNILECIFNVICNENGFVCCKNIIVNDMNNENFYYNGYYGYYEYLTPPTPTSATMFVFNETCNGLCGINIVKGIFGVGLCESNNIDK